MRVHPGRVIITGMGSAGSRLAGILEGQGHSVIRVSRRPEIGDFASVRDAVIQAGPTHAVIATETARHLPDLNELTESGFSGPILVEKPLFKDHADYAHLSKFSAGSELFVAYNLRFDPVIVRLMDRIGELEGPVTAAQLHVGQYLPDWRRGRRMQETYSASRDLGGGVLRDLSHEIDLSGLLFGEWQAVAALGGRQGAFEIESDDSWSMLVRAERCPALSIHLNYFERPARRAIRVISTHTTLEADLIAGSVSVNGEVEMIPRKPQQSYEDQLAAFMGGTGRDRLCGPEDGMRVMAAIAAVETAHEGGVMIRPGGMPG